MSKWLHSQHATLTSDITLAATFATAESSKISTLNSHAKLLKQSASVK